MYKRPEEQGGHAFLPLAWFRPPIHVRACQINAWPILRGCLLARRIDGIGFEQALQNARLALWALVRKVKQPTVAFIDKIH